MRITYRPLLRLGALLVLLYPLAAQAQNQTNDPLVSQQQYLFHAHRLDQAWAVTTGSSSTEIAIHSMLGFLDSHEDLSASRLLAPWRVPLAPHLGYATEAVGVVGAATNNGLGMAGIERAALLRSYRVLRPVQSGDPSANIVSYTDAGGTLHQYYFGLDEINSSLQAARADGADIHLITYALPTAKYADYGDGVPPINAPDVRLYVPNPDDDKQQREGFANALLSIVENHLFNLCFGSSCITPPSPMRTFYDELTRLSYTDDRVVVAPMGDVDGSQGTILYGPGFEDNYVVAVGGLELDPELRPIAWSRTLERAYVDVAAMAKDVVGLSGESSTAYNTGFGGTAAAASITAGVAGLLRSYDASLTTEDVEQVLERTAYDVGTTGFDNATGHGAVDAGAALEYVRDNQFQRVKATVATVLSDVEADVRTIELLGFQNYYVNGAKYATGKLRRFTARVAYGTFSAPNADVWVRWADSDGVSSDIWSGPAQPGSHYGGNYPYIYNETFEKSLRIVSSDQSGFTVEGYYIDATFYDDLGREVQYKHIPSSPAKFEVAYTVAAPSFGPPAVPPAAPTNLAVSNVLSPGQNPILTWDASSGATHYNVYRTCQLGYNGDCTPGTFSYLGTAMANSYTDYTVTIADPLYDFEEPYTYRVTAANNYGESDPSNQFSVGITSQLPGGPGGGLGGNSAAAEALEALPEAYALESAYPNPLREQARLRYALPEASQVRLVVFDALGREVARLVDGVEEAGYREAVFEVSHLPPGVYVAQFEAKGQESGQRYAVTQKLVVLK